MIARATPQLPLALRHDPDFSRDSFMAGPSNSAALALLEAWPNWPARLIVLSGPEGSGKTHLARIWAERAGADILAARSLLSEPGPLGPFGRALVVEDVDPDCVPERTLFHLINSTGESGTDLLFTSRQRAEEWRVGLADLRSRLRMAAPAALRQPDEELLRRALVKLFSDRQLLIDKPVIDYLVVRMERSFAAAVSLVAAIDQEGLATGKRITRRLVASVLPALAEVPGEFSGPQ